MDDTDYLVAAGAVGACTLLGVAVWLGRERAEDRPPNLPVQIPPSVLYRPMDRSTMVRWQAAQTIFDDDPETWDAIVTVPGTNGYRVGATVYSGLSGVGAQKAANRYVYDHAGSAVQVTGRDKYNRADRGFQVWDGGDGRLVSGNGFGLGFGGA